MHYSHDAAKKHCEKRGLHWHEGLALHADDMAHKHGLSQAAFDDAIVGHIDAMVHALTPANYTWKQRVAMAVGFFFMWLGVVKAPWN